MHVHLESQTRKGAVADPFLLNPADIAFESISYVYATLMAGFTTVRDLGGRFPCAMLSTNDSF
jgi:hypothetical protein